MNLTKLLFLQDSDLHESTATLISIHSNEDKTYTLILDQTIFYPQGGGQPCDTGEIKCEEACFKVTKTRFINGIVEHIGEFNNQAIAEGSKVLLKINTDRRKLNSQLHTAGHLVDKAMINTGNKMPPTKGYHFADSPYVEYDGVIEAEKREPLKADLNTELSRLIIEDAIITDKIYEHKAQLKDVCEFVPDYLPEGKPIRVVTVSGYGCPCGGTHVKSTGEIPSLYIAKIKVKSGKTRISYRIN